MVKIWGKGDAARQTPQGRPPQSGGQARQPSNASSGKEQLLRKYDIRELAADGMQVCDVCMLACDVCMQVCDVCMQVCDVCTQVCDMCMLACGVCMLVCDVCMHMVLGTERL